LVANAFHAIGAEQVTFGIIDVTRNTPPPKYTPEYLPQIVVFPAVNKSDPVYFNHIRSYNSIIAWLKTTLRNGDSYNIKELEESDWLKRAKIFRRYEPAYVETPTDT